MPSRRAPRRQNSALPQGSVLILSGTDPFQIKQIIQQLIERNGGESSCERRDYDAAQSETNQAVIDAASSSLFVPSRVIALHHVDQAKEHELEAVLSYINSPATDSVLTMIMASPKTRSEALKEIMSAVPVITVQKTPASDIKALVRQRLKEATVAMDSDALALLLDHVGNRGEDALAELEKIILWAGPSGRVDRETCGRLLTTEPEEEVWALTRSVAAKNPQAALLNLRRVYDQGVEPIQALGMLARLFRQMWSVCTAKEEGIPRTDWPTATGLKGFALQATTRQAHAFDREILERGLARIRETDDALKGGTSSPQIALERLIVELSATS